MKLGTIVRCNHKGLGIQSRSLVEHLRPDKILVVLVPDDPPVDAQSFYPGATVVAMEDLSLPLHVIQEFVSGLDLVWSAETFYDRRFVPVARGAGVKTVVSANYEFHQWIADPALERPDLFLAPSTWEIDRLPDNTLHLPWPVDTEAFPFEHRDQVRTFLHVAGHKAIHDRQGTHLLFTALRHVTERCRVVVTTQRKIVEPNPRRVSSAVDFELRIGDVEDNADLYREGEVLIAPRRYGGLSLPLNEGAARGMPVIALAREPETSLLDPASLIPTFEAGTLNSAVGRRLPLAACEPRLLAMKMDEMVRNPDLVSRLSDLSGQYARSISWDVLGPRYREVFEDLVARVPVR